MIRYSTQCIDEDDIEAVTQVLRSDFLTQGPVVDQFEKNIATYLGVKYAVSVSNATAALHLSCLALGIDHHSRVWTSPISFVASANCARYCGASVDFVDIDNTTYNLCPAKLEEKLIAEKKNGKLPHVLIVVHLAGQSCDMKKIYELSLQYDFKIIEDASHALGAEYENKKVGGCQYSEVSVFSFHPVKMITTGEGGLIATNNSEIENKIKYLRSHGLVKSNTDLKKKSDGPWYYEQQILGYNYRLTEIQAALGLSQLKKLDRFVEKRRKIAQVYDQKLSNLPLLLPKELSVSKMSFHLYIVRLQKKITEKKLIFEKLFENGIGVQVHYIPIYHHPYYKSQAKYEKCNNAEKYYEQAISLPNHPNLTFEEQSYVINSLEKVLI